jgi:hypothetical protein
MIKNKNLLVFFALVLMFGFFLPPFTAARDITITPQLYGTGEYNDNILFSRTDKEDDFIFYIAPAMELTYASDLWDLYSLAMVQFRRHLSEDDLDREDYFLNLRGRYRMTERLQFQGRLDYRQDFTTETRTIDFAEPVLEEIPIDESDIVERGIESFLSERKRYNAFASLNYRLTEVSDLNLGYRYLKMDYDSDQNTDYDVNDLNLRYMRRLAGQKDRVGTRVSYSERTSDISDVETYGIGLIWHRTFTETINFYADIGLRYSEETLKNTGEKDDNVNGTADIRLRRRGETNEFTLGFRQNVQTQSAGGAVNVSRLYWDAQQTLSERLAFKLGGYFYITREDGSSLSDINIVFFDIAPSLRYMLTENHSVSLAYNYTIEHNRTLETNRDKERNRVWIVFEFGFPDKW